MPSLPGKLCSAEVKRGQVEEPRSLLAPRVRSHQVLSSFPSRSPPLFLPFSFPLRPLSFFPMRKLFTRDKPKLAKVTPAPRDVPPDLTSANTSEVTAVTTSSRSPSFFRSPSFSLFFVFFVLFTGVRLSSLSAGVPDVSTATAPPPFPIDTSPPPAPCHPSVSRR